MLGNRFPFKLFSALLPVMLMFDNFKNSNSAVSDLLIFNFPNYQCDHQYAPPEVIITVDSKLLCPGQSVTFTAAVTSGGAKPMYQWQINGINKGTDNPVFTPDADAAGKLIRTDVIRCIVTNLDSGESGISNLISSIVVLKVPVTDVFMYESHGIYYQEYAVCQGTPIIFLAGIATTSPDIPIDMLDPTFHYTLYYQLNGIDLPVAHGTDISPYVKNGDVLTLKLTYTSKCYSGSVISNATTIYITPSATPSVTISSENSSNCAGSPVKFIASAVNAGKTPSYRWLLNGQNAGTNDSTFTSSMLKTGDQLQCKVISSNTCVAGAASSNLVTVNLLPVIPNSVNITSDISGKYITAGQTVIFSASVPDTANVTYQWFVNGKNAGTNSANFSSNLLVLGDVVTCKVVKSGKCVAPQTAVSNAITILIIEPLIVPNTFTPNGDGINDTWNLRGLLAYPGALVQVYNRYGAMVYQSIGYTSGWDGNSNGKALPVGTYYYLIDLKNGKQKLSGSITILR